MNVAIRKPLMSRDEFLGWPGHADGRFEFDGFRPVAITGGSLGSSRIGRNLLLALTTRLGRGACQALGPDAGIATVGDAVRYPDVLVTCSPFRDGDYLTPGVIAVFEVTNNSSGRNDRVVKVREYQAVPSIRRYAIIEHRSIGATMLSRSNSGADWTTTPIARGGLLELPELGITLPIDLLYEGTEVAAASG